MDSLQSLSQAVLALAQSGQPVPRLLLEGLADAVLQAPLVQLAFKVKGGAPLEAAVELVKRALNIRDSVNQG